MGFMLDTSSCAASSASFDEAAINRTQIPETKDGFDPGQMQKLRQASDSTPGQAYGMLSTELLDLVNNFTHSLSALGVVMGQGMIWVSC